MNLDDMIAIANVFHESAMPTTPSMTMTGTGSTSNENISNLNDEELNEFLIMNGVHVCIN